MRGWLLLLLWGLTLSVAWAASTVRQPPPTKDAALYEWQSDITNKMGVITTTNRLPVSGVVSGTQGELLVAITSTNTLLFVNVSTGPGLSKNWKEISLK